MKLWLKMSDSPFPCASCSPCTSPKVKSIPKDGAANAKLKRYPDQSVCTPGRGCQDSFKVDAKKWSAATTTTSEKNVGRLIDAYREAKLPVIFLHTHDEDAGFGTGPPMFKLMDELQPRSSKPVIQKNTRNAFTSTGLSALLLEKGVRKVAITGIQMEQCCETTARVAADLAMRSIS